MRNKFCSDSSLKNESDVEQFFIIKLLEDLGFTEDYVETKTTIPELKIKKGKNRTSYHPDYIAYKDKKHEKPVIIIDAKHPNENSEEGVIDAQLYTSVLRRKLLEPKPEQLCIGTNGFSFVVKHYDNDKEIFRLRFEDFNDKSVLYNDLKKRLSLQTLQKNNGTINGYDFEFKKIPNLIDLKNLFSDCHDLIWAAETSSPSFAFYEFVKLMFVKLEEDKKLVNNEKLSERVKVGLPISSKDVIFSVRWIEEQEKNETDLNPINDVLFKNLTKKLEDLIYQKKKKRIFETGEEIKLKATTIKTIVGMLEHYNLYGIDEDLNGRMFEAFLNATMRGAELGQFFTPRSVTKFMTNLANLEVKKEKMDYVIDACCGSGGFLIEALTIMENKIKRMTNLSDKEQKDLFELLTEHRLYGIDAGKDPPIARIARINMYLHGDGGSKIYFADALNKNISIDKNTDKELKRDLEELKEELKNKFNVALTNPPFAIKYKGDKKEHLEILEQYEISRVEGTNKFYNTSRSNILFLERYKDLLDKGGKLFTIIDDTPLNGSSPAAKAYRKFIRKYFIIKAVISLPKNTFVNADTSPKISVLYLKKKETENERQPTVFMAISKSIGHDSTGRKSNDSDLDLIKQYFDEFEEKGTIKELNGETQIFLVQPNELKDEINPYIYCPELKSIKETLKKLNSSGKINLVLGKNMPLVGNIIGKEKEKIKHDILKYIALRDVTTDGGIIKSKILEYKAMPTRAKKRLKKYDVIMSRNAGSLGKVAVIPEWLDGDFCSDGFLVFRAENEKDALLLATILKSDLVQKQMFYAQRESIQPDIKETTFKQRIIIPYPNDSEIKRCLTDNMSNIQKERNKIKDLQEKNWDIFNIYTGWKPITRITEDLTEEDEES